MESYLVIARKWRPQTFEEMIGQDHVSRTLYNALKSQRLHHALLFTGPRGVGKTSSARILAKSLKCPNSKDFVPCNVCSTCQEIISGSNMDVMEIDGASHNGVDAIRELRETVGYMPAQGRHKIYIVDEVHMLSVSAFNALLKTLEEPPPHVIFIFATTEPQKIPLTILSRVQRFDFRRIPTRLLTERLEQICKREEVQYDKESLWLIARQADGSARDSQSLLDQIITFCDGKVSAEKTIEVLGLTNRKLILDTMESLVHQNIGGVLDVVKSLYEGGADSKVFVQDLLESIRNTLLLKLENNQGLVDLPDSEIEALKKIGSALGEEDLHFLFDMALKASSDILRAQDQRLALEMSLLRMSQAPRIQSFMNMRSSQEASGNNTLKKKSEIPRSSVTPLLSTQSAAPAQAQSVTPPITPPVTRLIPENASKDERWGLTVVALKEKKPFLGAKLDHVALKEMNGENVTLSMAKDKKFLYDQLSSSESIKELSESIGSIWNKNVQLNWVLEDTSPQTPLESQKKRKAAEDTRVQDEVESHPLMKSVKSNFKIQIKSITSDHKLGTPQAGPETHVQDRRDQ